MRYFWYLKAWNKKPNLVLNNYINTNIYISWRYVIIMFNIHISRRYCGRENFLLCLYISRCGFPVIKRNVKIMPGGFWFWFLLNGQTLSEYKFSWHLNSLSSFYKVPEEASLSRYSDARSLSARLRNHLSDRCSCSGRCHSNISTVCPFLVIIQRIF